MRDSLRAARIKLSGKKTCYRLVLHQVIWSLNEWDPLLQMP